MTFEKVRELHQARPFRPFALRLADGRSIRVGHPEFMAISPSRRLAHVFYEGDNSEFIDLMLVISVELGKKGAGASGRRK